MVQPFLSIDLRFYDFKKSDLNVFQVVKADN